MPSRKSPRLKESAPPVWRNRFCWLPFVGALITLIPAILVILNLWEGLPKQLNFNDILNLDEIPFLAADLDARTFYFLSLLLLAVSAIVAITVSGYIIVRFFKETSKKVILAWVVLVAMAISIFVFVPKIRALVPTKDFYEPIFLPTERTIEEAEGKNGYSDPTFLKKTKPTADFVNMLVVLGIVMVVAAFSASLHAPESAGAVSVEMVAFQRKKLLLALYSGAGLLIFGVVATYAAVRIPSVFLSALSAGSEQYLLQAKYMKEVALMITTTFGVTFTLALAGGYFPASIVITERAKSLAVRFGKAKPDFDTQKWLEEQKLATSPFQRLTRGVAVLAPFLVSLSQVVVNLF